MRTLLHIVMKMIVATMCLGLASTACSQPGIEPTRATFDSAIVSFDKTFVRATTWDNLFDVAQFVKMYEHPRAYTEKAVAFIANSEYTERQKRICVCAMQRLSLTKYLVFVQQCDSLYRRSDISEKLLMWTISPNFSNRYIIPRNYKSKNVQLVLSSILRKGVSVEHDKSIRQILSGKRWSFLVNSGAAK